MTNIQNEAQKIHNQYGMSEMANYKIQLLCEQYAKEYHDSEVKKLNIPAVMLSLPSQDEIDEQIDKYAFRVPYDGSNNFYDEVALKHYKAGIEWLLGRIRGNGA